MDLLILERYLKVGPPVVSVDQCSHLSVPLRRSPRVEAWPEHPEEDRADLGGQGF